MTLLFHTYLFILGLIMGSFYNVVGLRVPDGQSIVAPRSACPACGRQLSARELIPVLSYVFQKGKCTSCKTGISIKYPLFELATAILFTIAPVVVGWSKELMVALPLISLLIIITISDLEYMLIPNKVLLFFAGLFIIIRFVVPLDPWYDALVGSAVGFGLLLLIAIVSKGGMGGGDIKLFAVLGLVLGLEQTLLAFFLSTVFGSVFGVLGMVTGKVKRGKPMPFGPYIALGGLTSYFYASDIIRWYVGQFL